MEEITTTTRRTTEEITAEIIEFFTQNDEIFAACIEELDSYNGYLGDRRQYEMELLDEFYAEVKPLEFLNRVFYGHDDDTSTEHNYTEFNPNRAYFYYNGYGNLVSTDYRDYSDYLDHWAVEAMAEHRNDIYSIDDDDELVALFDELEAAQEAEEEPKE